jgi:serine/threonine protein kinase
VGKFGFKTDQIDDESVAKVADFGIARTDDRNSHADLKHTEGYRAKTHSVTKRVFGTGPYMPQEYMHMGHVSEKTDAFALGILILELLISGAIKTEYPEEFPLKARGLVDSEEPDTLSDAVLAMATKGGWAGENGLLAAKVLTDVAISLTRVTSKRQTPVQVLPQLETAYRTYLSINL